MVAPVGSSPAVLEFAPQLVPDELGIYRAENTAAISYPDFGNDLCFQLEERSFWFQHRNDCIAALINGFPCDGTLLDAGGGNGYVTKRLIEEGHDCVLLEPGPAGAANGKSQRDLPNVICATLAEASISNGSLGGIGCFDVIEHIENEHAFVDQIWQALKPDGYLYLTVPSYTWLWSYSDISAHHFRRYTDKTINDLLGNRFATVYSSYFFQLLTVPIALLRALPYRLGLARKRSVVSKESAHATGESRLGDIARWLHRRESIAINEKRSLSFGSSLILVAQKCT